MYTPTSIIPMIFREATTEDIEELMGIRISVKENALSDPSLITANDYKEYLIHRGKGWVCENNGVVVAFAIVDMIDNNVWALFVQPGFEKKGLGKELHKIMLDWYFSKTGNSIWLSTSVDTRAENFYRKAGWKQNGLQPNGEIRFEMSLQDWKKAESNNQ